MTVGVDVGGTFTDLARWDGKRLVTGKRLTTPDQGEGVASATRDSGGPDRLLLHGTTVATNALLERRGAEVTLITDAGFEDLIEIGRQDRPSLYDPFANRPPPLVDRRRRHGWAPGTDLALDDPKAVAVALLFSYRDPQPERDLATAVARRWPQAVLSVSHRVSGEFREFERAATTVLNAYLQPVVSRYLGGLEQRLEELVERVLVMRSSGGLTSVAGAAELAASILLSGPAGGVVAAAACGGAHGWRRVISFDMGGTSTDVCRIEDGRPQLTAGRTLDGVTCRLPSLAIHTIGAGGGSLAWSDPGGALRVGPRSAGARPGPACYGFGGTDPTVTDANLIAGRLGTDQPLAGGLRLDEGAAAAALAGLGVGDQAAAAAGVIEVVEVLMERAIRRVTVEEGADPRQAALVAFGGAGGLHASALARRLEMPAVLIPPHAGVFSALGLLLSPSRCDLARTVLLAEGDAALEEQLAKIETAVTAEFAGQMGRQPQVVEITLDMRYPGQSHETTVPYRPGDGWAAISARFHEAHLAFNGFAAPEQPAELVTIRAGAVAPPGIAWADISHPPRPGDEPGRLGTRRGPGGEEIVRWWRPGLAAGAEVGGPAVIAEPEATTWVGAGERARVLEDGTIEVTW
jgi:N-methylhydantoinase A